MQHDDGLCAICEAHDPPMLGGETFWSNQSSVSWIMCDGCDEWSHVQCAKSAPLGGFVAGPWYCELCLANVDVRLVNVELGIVNFGVRVPIRAQSMPRKANLP